MKSRFWGKSLSYFSRLNLGKKFLIMLLGITVIPIIALQTVSIVIMDQIAQKQMEDFSSSRLQQSYNSIDIIFHSYDSIVKELSQDSLVQENVKNINVWGSRYRQSMLFIRNQLEEKSMGQEGILGVAVVANNETMICYDRVTYSQLDNFCFPFSARDYLFSGTDAAEVAYRYNSVGTLSMEGYPDKQVVYISYPITDNQRRKIMFLGSIVIAVDGDYLASALDQNKSSWYSSFIMNQKGEILAFRDKNYLEAEDKTPPDSLNRISGEIESMHLSTGLINLENFRASFMTYPNRDVVLVDVLDNNDVSRPWRIMVALITLLGTMVIGIALLVIRYTSYDIRSKVEIITRSMKRADQGDLSTRAHIKGEDEFAVIASHYNRMLVDMEDMRVEQANMTESLKAAEISALESQINPHFIYNTLDSINWLAIQNEEYEISAMLKNLGEILRYSVHQSTKIVTLEQELTYLRQYLTLQQHRYRYSFTSIIDIQPGIEKAQIPKMLIQPLIENCLLHAFPHSDNDNVWVICRRGEEQYHDSLIIQVMDNGKGMSEGLIEKFNSYSYTHHAKTSHIGVRNVISRIQMYYEQAGSVVIQDRPDGGTIITLKLPLKEDISLEDCSDRG